MIQREVEDLLLREDILKRFGGRKVSYLAGREDRQGIEDLDGRMTAGSCTGDGSFQDQHGICEGSNEAVVEQVMAQIDEGIWSKLGRLNLGAI